MVALTCHDLHGTRLKQNDSDRALSQGDKGLKGRIGGPMHLEGLDGDNSGIQIAYDTCEKNYWRWSDGWGH